MNLLLTTASIGFWLVGVVLILMVSYLLVLTLAAWLTPVGKRRTQGPARHRFLFLIPAHNEEQLLPKLLTNLNQLDYPQSHYVVHVVADNCTDRTAELARNLGAVAHERFDQQQIGKGYALQWLLNRVRAAGEVFDAAVIIDADSVVSANFLRVMDDQLQQGALVVQSYDGVLNPARSWAVSLRAMAMAVLNYLRPLGRMPLGGSAGLKGNGMVFHRTILEQYAWSASVTEDIEYHMTLLLNGVRVRFAPEAVVWAEMPETLANSHTQNVRWEQGRLEMARRYIPRLLRHAFFGTKRQAQVSPFVLLDAMMDLLIPPFAIVAGVTLLFLALAPFLGGTTGLLVALYLLVGQLLYLLSGLLLTKAPVKVYLALLYTPLFIVWKIWLYLRVLLRFEQQGWVRAVRDSA